MPTSYHRPASIRAALESAPEHAILSADERAYIAGGTDLVPLMRSNIADPRHLVDIRHAGLPRTVEPCPGGGLVIGASATMSAVAGHALVRQRCPAIAEALLASASPQVRNAASIGGNLLQRTRCGYFRDTAFPCNKRHPGSGCPARDGDNRRHAILGGSPDCVAVHASDLAVSLAALDARLRLVGPAGERRIPLTEFYLDPGETPWRETVLEDRELIAAVEIEVPGASSAYVKVRDRASFEFALVSAAAVVALDGGQIARIAIALGGVAPRPWRLMEAEAELRGAAWSGAAVREALHSNLAEARPLSGNGFKIELACRAAQRAVALAGGGR